MKKKKKAGCKSDPRGWEGPKQKTTRRDKRTVEMEKQEGKTGGK